jgi:hypothetical protein
MRTIAAIALAAFLGGCAVLDWRYSLELLRKDANACKADPKAFPGCIAGIEFRASRPIDL